MKMLGSEPGGSYMQSTRSTTELHPLTAQEFTFKPASEQTKGLHLDLTTLVFGSIRPLNINILCFENMLSENIDC